MNFQPAAQPAMTPTVSELDVGCAAVELDMRCDDGLSPLKLLSSKRELAFRVDGGIIAAQALSIQRRREMGSSYQLFFVSR